MRAGEAAIGPALLVRALVVSLIARMRSLPATIAGGIAVGVCEAVIRANVDSADQSIVDLYLFGATLVLVLFVVRSGRDEEGWSLSARVKPIPERLRHLWYVRWLPRIGFAALFTFLGVLPFFLDERSQQFLWTDILIVAMAALPISMLTGWAGQLSLGQFAFVGLGALTMGVVSNGLEVPLPFTDSYLQWELPWILAALVATAVGTAAALIVGLPALRVRGLFLAVCTISFAVACSNWLFRQPVFVGSEFSTVTPIQQPPELLGIDFSDRRNFYWLCFARAVGHGPRRGPVAAHRRGPIDDRGAGQRGHGRHLDGVPRADEADRLHAGRGHGRLRRLPVHDPAHAGQPVPGLQPRRLHPPGGHRHHRRSGLGGGADHRGPLGAGPPRAVR